MDLIEIWGFCEDIKNVKDIKDIKDIMNIVDDNNNNSDTTGKSSFLPPAPRVSPPVPPYKIGYDFIFKVINVGQQQSRVTNHNSQYSSDVISINNNNGINSCE